MKLTIFIFLLISLSILSDNKITTKIHSPKKSKIISNIEYLGNYPTNKYGSWTNELQGVGNDDKNWFFTQKKAIWKMPKEIDFEQNKYIQPEPENGVFRMQIPEVLSENGYNHFGDLDVKNGFIFIPVEKQNRPKARPVIAVFKSSDLSFVDYVILPKYFRSGWCAVNNKGILFTSSDEINRRKPIVKYQISWDELEHGNLELSYIGDFKLGAIPKRFENKLEKYIQGADFSDDDKYFFIVNGKVITKRKNRGIWIFENLEGMEGKYVNKSLQEGNFKYKFKRQEESQGLTYWDLGNKEKGGGQLHVMLLNLNFTKKPSLFFKHYKIE